MARLNSKSCSPSGFRVSPRRKALNVSLAMAGVTKRDFSHSSLKRNWARLIKRVGSRLVISNQMISTDVLRASFPAWETFSKLLAIF